MHRRAAGMPRPSQITPIVQILDKYASHSRRIWGKTSDRRQPPFQASLLKAGSNAAEKTGRGRDEGRLMKLLLRAAFWLTIVILILPSRSPAPSGQDVDAANAVSAASAAVSDVRRFCERQPEACTIGSQAATVFGQKAQAGAKMLYEFVSEKISPTETGSIAIPGSKKVDAAGRTQNTLLPSDIAPSWRGSESRSEGRTKGPA